MYVSGPVVTTWVTPVHAVSEAQTTKAISACIFDTLVSLITDSICRPVTHIREQLRSAPAEADEG
jgi:hypothetical protein